MATFQEEYSLLVRDLDHFGSNGPSRRPFERVWSFGDMEGNGVFYHPRLTNYAHQAFEEFFYERTGLHYADLSRQTEKSEQVRRLHSPKIPRMTFPVQWLYQWMVRPMEAGDRFQIGVDVVDLGRGRVGVRAWVFDGSDQLAAVVIWLRVARELDGEQKFIDIHSWFPRK